MSACYHEQSMTLTFDGELSGSGNDEFVGLRHPLVRAALRIMRGDESGLGRFATITLDGDPVEEPVVVLLSLFETTGLRPRLELLSEAIGLVSMQRDEAVGDRIMQSLTQGGWRDAEDESPTTREVRVGLAAAREHTERRRFSLERERATANAALVDARIATQHGALTVKIQQAGETLARVSGRDARLTRMYEGRIRNLREKRSQVAHELGQRRALAVSVRPVALALVLPS